MPVGMLGGGFPPETVDRGIALGADIIAVDGGSTDSGPYYLGAGVAKTARAAVARDLRAILPAAHAAGIPVVVGSCGTAGTNAGVDWVHDIAREIAADEGLNVRVARIYSEQRAEHLTKLLARKRIHPLEPAGALTPETLGRCSHIVGLMGHEPIADALAAGADIVLAGRSTDTALSAVLPLTWDLPPGPVWHAAKIAECGGLCTTDPRAGGVLVTLDPGGFTIDPLAQTAACTPASVAAHMMYENADPFLLREPAGVLDTSRATYTALDNRRVRVEGSRFEPAAQHTIKLEGAAPVGYQTIVISGMRDPGVLARLDEWCDRVLNDLHHRIPKVFGLTADDYDVQIRRYGHDAVLGAAEPDFGHPPREVGIVFIATAADQATATQLAKFANPSILHAPLADEKSLPSYAFLGSPAEIERGQVYEFLLQHVVDVTAPDELFSTVYGDLTQTPEELLATIENESLR
ncbi:acyclic terpene utilization AtuA family protein [Amycolatopsis sp. cmx-8-4]|uniref:acyclic terpene utilization AtuA family protein n=1 Tax=Amycolatopsis sp. cmx-8-4 TaxID=2790947 RepID=UPI00397D8AB2